MAFTKDISFRIDSIMDVSQINKALSQVQKGLSGLKLPQNLNNDIKNTISSLTQELDEFRQLTSKDLTSMKDIKNVTSSYQRIVNYYKKLGEYTKKIDNKDLKNLIPDSAIKNIEKATKALNDYEIQVEDTQKSINNLNKEIDKQQKALNATSEKRSKLAAENITLGSQKSNTNKQIKATERQLKDLYEQQKKTAKGSVEYKQLSNQIDILQTNLKKLNKAYNDATATIDKNKVAISGYNEEIKQAKSSISSLTQESQKLKATGIDQPFEQLRQKIAEVKGVDISEIPEDFNKLKNIIDSLTSEELDKIRTQVEQIKTSSNDASPAVRKIGDAIDSVTAEANELNRVNREISNLASQVEYFFGIENTIELFKRGIRQAYQSVKELDKAMTETAVVTDFSVGDMWEALPRYTAAANELGTTTLGAYETMTLYYQQGLKTNEVFEIGTETMKMARIASMDYTKATDLMTAALRGFNMELNQTSAQRINDVYSELAAITAADTEEIADAMTRTASIASSAGMEFETTSAFLSQMIETTREAPENLGTAMKTIIARFQELKKAPSEIASEVDGEAINVNKIDAALKSIGVSLMDNVTGQFRELDDVFLEIAGKWDGLDKNTQRYIATVAAGSRQQSRFIAMMSNYDRTMELVDAANNSAGASQRQFEKTTESLESKVNKAKNAWNEFTRNLANSTVIKGAVDLFTKLINVFNKFLNTMPSGISMIVALAASLKTLGTTRKVILALINTLVELSTTSGAKIIPTLFDSLTQQFKGTGKKASVIDGILGKLKTALGKRGVAGAAAEAGTSLQVVGTEVSTMGASFAVSVGSILSVVAAIGAVIAVGYALWSTTQETERELKRVSKAANDAANHTNTLKDAISNLEEKQQEMEDIDSSFDNLIEGTTEWNSKLIESNSLISEIISQFPEMAQYLKTIDGRMQFDEAGWDEVNKRFEERLQTASNLQASLTARQATLSAKVAAENIDLATGPDTLLYGISEERKITYGKYFAENPQYLGLSNEDLRLQMQQDGMDVESTTIMNGLIESADELAEAFNNYTIASDSENAVIRNLLQSNLNNAGITGSAAVAASNIASKSYNPEEIDPFLWFNNAADEEQTRAWAEKMGYRIDSYSGWGQGVKYTDLATGESGEISNEEVLVQFNELEAQQEATKVAEEVANSLTIDNKAFAENFESLAKDTDLSEAFSGLLSGDTLVDKDLVDTIVGNPNDLSSAINNMLDSLSDDEKAERIANYLGEDIEEVKKNIPHYTLELIGEIHKNAKNIQKNQKKQDNKLRGMVGKASGLTPEDIKFYQERPESEKGLLPYVDEYVESLEEDQKQFLVEIGDKLTTNLGEEALQPFLANMKDIYDSNNEALIQKATDYISSIDFSNPIKASRDLKLGIESNIKPLSDMSKRLLEVGDSSLNASAQFQYLYQQDSFSDIAEEIDKVVLKEGKIDGAGVLELTSKSSDLKDMIDNTGISVETLGDTFTALSKGDIALSDLTAGVMAALSAFDQLDGVIQETSDFISNLDLGPDMGKFSEDLHSTVESIIEMYENGEYGNLQIENLIKQLFGEDRWNQALAKANGDLQVAASQFMDDLRLINDDLSSVWASIDEKGQKRLDEYNNKDDRNLGIQIDQLESGEMQLDIGKASTEEVVQGIMEAYQVTEEYANLMLTDFANKSADLRSELAENDWTAGIQEYLKNNKLTTYEDGKEEEKPFINENDITTLSKVTGKDEIVYWRQLAKELEVPIKGLKTVQEIKDRIGTERTVINFDTSKIDEVKEFFGKTYHFDFDENTTAERLAEVKELVNDTVLDLDKVQETLSSLGVPPEVISQIQTDLASIWGEESEDNKVKLGGVELSATEVADDIEAATEKAAKQADYTAMGEAIASALSKELKEVNPEYNTSNAIKKNEEVAKDLKTKTDSAIYNGAKTGIDKAKSEWNNWTLGGKSATLTINPELSKTTITLTPGQDGKNVYLGFGARKEGTDRKGLPKKETALVGEVGPELVENQDGTATLYGVNGPTIANLNKGAIVHNAQDTKKILRGNDNFKTINRYENKKLDNKSTAYGGGKKNTSTSSKTNSNDDDGSSKKGKSKQNNNNDNIRDPIELPDYSEPLDKLYNVLKRIEKEQRMISKYQERYERLLTQSHVTGKDIVKNLHQQEKYYRSLVNKNVKVRDTRQDQIKKALNSKVKYEYTYKTTAKKDKKTGKRAYVKGDEVELKSRSNLSKYLKYDKDYNLVTVKNRKSLEKLRKSEYAKDRALYDAIIEELNKLNGYQTDIEEANDKIEEGTNALEDLNELGHDAFRSLEDRVYQAIIQREQQKIDKLSQIDDSINNTNQQLMSTIQNNLSKIRQDRQNKETEEDIASKERRLAYLRQDTSGANALEIKQLEEELANQKQDYTDSLIDQKITELQEQNDAASQERQQQIDLLNSQLKYDEQMGKFWPEAHDMIKTGFDKATGALIANSELVKLLQTADNWEGLSKQGQMDWMKELNSNVAEVAAWLTRNENAETVLNDDSVTLEELYEKHQVKDGDQITLKDKNGKTIKGKVVDGNFVYDGVKGDGVTFNYGNQITQNEDGTFSSVEGMDEAREFTKTKKKNTQTIYKLKGGKIVKDVVNRNVDGSLTWPVSKEPVGTVYQGENRKYYTEAARDYINNHPKKYPNFKWRYKEGGLADFTGPAWLDGTKTKPEMVLNQKDTKNFIQLKDILRDLLANNGDIRNRKSGDNYYEISIEVDSLSSDYDVEQMATKVKKMITNDAKYRNVNAVKFIR